MRIWSTESTVSHRPRSATALFAAALLLFVIGSLVAWQQPPRLFPLKPQTTAEWWLQPLEHNAFQRMPRVGENLNDVFVVPTTGKIWAVGNDGLIIHSRDGGRTWEHVKTGFDKPSSTGQFETSASDLTDEQILIKKQLNALYQQMEVLREERDAEVNGISGSRIKGSGVRANVFTNEIFKKQNQINDLEKKLNDSREVAANHESKLPEFCSNFFHCRPPIRLDCGR